MSMPPDCGMARWSLRSCRSASFWEAEPDHQDYLEKRPNGYTCHFVRPGWVLPKRKTDDDAQPATGIAAE